MEIVIVLIICVTIYSLRRGKIKEKGEIYTGKIIDVTTLGRNYIIEAEINGEIKTLKSLEECPLVFPKGDYIGKKTKIYYNENTPNRCSLVYNVKFDLKRHLED